MGAVYAAGGSDCRGELVELLPRHGAAPHAAGPDGRSPYRLATSLGRDDLTALLRRPRAADEATGAKRVLSACLRTDRAQPRRLLAGEPVPPDRVAAPIPPAPRPRPPHALPPN